MSQRSRRCSIYQGTGEICGQRIDLETPVSPRSRVRPSDADQVLVSQIMTTDIVCARPDLEIAGVVALMIRNHIGCIPVIDDRRHPVGVITKFDIVEQLDAYMQSVANGSPMPADLAARRADELMMPLAMTLQEHATVAHAAAMMTTEDLHHVVIVDRARQIVGIVSTKDITNWLVENDGLASSMHETSS